MLGLWDRAVGPRCGGALGWDAWQRFAAEYPTVVDCVYYRLKDAAAHAELRRDAEKAHAELAEMEG
eukprot:gene21859-47760_t